MPADNQEFVRVPKAIFDQLEAKAKRALQLEEGLKDFAAAVHGKRITAVLTHPPSGSEAPIILHAVESLVQLVRPQ